MNVLFMGTPDFACFSLSALLQSPHRVTAVVTQPDKPRGRGYTLTPPPVKVAALEAGIPVYQPTTLRDDDFASLLAEIDPDVIVVVAYGKILPQNVLDYPKYGCINVHGSLLPQYRGAAPMQRAIIDGCATTGITTMYMAAGLDTGDMLLREDCPITDEDNFETIHDKLGALGADMIVRTLDGLADGTLTRVPQNEAEATYAAKILKDDCAVSFDNDARTVHNLIRGLSPIPLSFTHTPDGKLLKLVAAKINDENTPHDCPGKVIALNDGITVACRRGSLTVLQVLPEGKGRMSAADFIRGRKIALGDILA